MNVRVKAVRDRLCPKTYTYLVSFCVFLELKFLEKWSHKCLLVQFRQSVELIAKESSREIHQHGVSILGSVNLWKTFLRLSEVW